MATCGNLVHQQRRGNVYYFRIAIPAKLQTRFGCLEYKRSLDTGDRKTANRLCRILSNRAEDFFTAMSTTSASPDDLKRFMRGYFEKRLLEAKFEHSSAMMMLQARPPQEAELDPYGGISVNHSYLMSLKAERASGGSTPEFDQEARSILRDVGMLQGLAPESELGPMLLDAEIEVTRIQLAHNQADFAGLQPRHPVLLDCVNPFDPSQTAATAAQPFTLGQCVSRFLAQKSSSVEPKTMKSIKAILDRLCDILGPARDMSSIKKNPDGIQLENAVPRIPANFVRDFKSKGARPYQPSGLYRVRVSSWLAGPIPRFSPIPDAPHSRMPQSTEAWRTELTIPTVPRRPAV